MGDQPSIPDKGGFSALLRRLGLSSGGGGNGTFSMFELSGEAWLVTDGDGRTLFTTNAWKRSFPCPAGGEPGLSGLKSLVSVPDAASEIERLMAGAVQGTAMRGEICAEAPNNRHEWWSLLASPDGSSNIYWRANDVTSIRERETRGRLESEMISDFLDNLPVGFFALDADGSFSYANSTLARWLGLEVGDLSRGKVAFQDVLAGDDMPPEEGVGYVTMQVAGGGDSFRAFVIRNNRGHAGGARAVVLRDPESGNDVEPDMATAGGDRAGGASIPPWLFDDAPIGIAVLREDGSIVSCNLALARFLDEDREALSGTQIASHVSAEDRDDVSAALSKLVMGTARAVHAEVRLPGEGADARAASLHAARMESDNAEEEDGSIILHVIDETEQRHLEVQFTQSQKMQAIGQLAGGVAHDFNNLLTAMIGFCDLLLQRHGPDDPSFADIQQIKQNANRATNLVRQLLAFSRKQTLEPVILDPTEALADLSHLLGRLIGEQVELNLEHAPDIHLVRADRGQFDQVIINLVVNARDAMPGGGTLTVRTHNETVIDPVQRGPEIMPPGAYVVVEVADTGTGIAKEDLERIFEPFFSTKEVGAGTGLGLSTVYGIVRQSDGYIFVDSAIGHGTTFSIYLPAHGAEGEIGLEAAAAADKALAERRAAVSRQGAGSDEAADLTGEGVVLLVEDEDAVRLFGARALKNKGYTVLEADNGETALDVLNSADRNIDIIVSDVVMPGMDGHTFVQLVRQEMPDIKVILMSGYAEDVFREEISRDPTIHFLAKPFSLKTLAGTVKDVLAG